MLFVKGVFMRKIFIYLVSVLLFTTSATAQVVGPGDLRRMQQTNGHEYYVGASLGKPLITVNLVNGVRSPGVYHIPTETDLAQLFSYAGGTLHEFDLSDVNIRSQKNGRIQVANFNFEKAISRDQQMPILLDKDIVHLQKEETLDKTFRWVSLASMVATIALTIVVIEDR